MARNRFYNPASGETYNWPINHSDEASFGKTRQVATGGNTNGNTGLTMQQGDDEPMVIELTGTILEYPQHEQMIRWFAISRDQTIHFYDFANEGYEVVILSYLPTRVRTLRNPRNGQLYYYRYTLRMQVVRMLVGGWTQVAP